MIKSIKIWCGVNRDNTISIHSVEPIKNNVLGIWVSNAPYVNSMLHVQMAKLLKNAALTFDDDPEYFEINMTIPDD